MRKLGFEKVNLRIFHSSSQNSTIACETMGEQGATIEANSL